MRASNEQIIEKNVLMIKVYLFTIERIAYESIVGADRKNTY